LNATHHFRSHSLLTPPSRGSTFFHQHSGPPRPSPAEIDQLRNTATVHLRHRRPIRRDSVVEGRSSRAHRGSRRREQAITFPGRTINRPARRIGPQGRLLGLRYQSVGGPTFRTRTGSAKRVQEASGAMRPIVVLTRPRHGGARNRLHGGVTRHHDAVLGMQYAAGKWRYGPGRDIITAGGGAASCRPTTTASNR